MEETEGQQESPLYQVKLHIRCHQPVEGVGQPCPRIIHTLNSNQVKLQSQYEEGITGVHLMNKHQQQYAMDEFVAGEKSFDLPTTTIFDL